MNASPQDMNEDIEAFRNVLKEAKRVVVVAGAGLSAASGKDRRISVIRPHINATATRLINRYTYVPR